MITFVTSFKSMEGLFRIIQRNAIKSWLKFCRGCDVVVAGEERGVKEVVDEFGLKLVRDVRRSKYGTPLFNDMIQKAEMVADNDYICFLNGDIILLSDFVHVYRALVKKFNEFLGLSVRVNLDVFEELDFDDPHVVNMLMTKAEQLKNNYIFPTRGAGFDIMLFRRGFFSDMPPFVIGRGNAYIRWMIYYTKIQKRPVIEMSPVVTAIHQNHEYTHIRDPRALELMRSGHGAYLPTASEEYLWNVSIAGVACYYSGNDTDYLLTRDGLKRLNGMKRVVSRLLKSPLQYRHSNVFLPLIRSLLINKRARKTFKETMFKLGLLY